MAPLASSVPGGWPPAATAASAAPAFQVGLVSPAGGPRALAPRAPAASSSTSAAGAGSAAGAASLLAGVLCARRATAAARHRRRARQPLRMATAAPTLADAPPPLLELSEDDPSAFTVGILGDLHLDPRDLEHSYEGREHMKAALKGTPRPFVVSLGDLGESKDCNQTKQLFSGTTDCFNLAREYLDGFGAKWDVVGGNHDLEGIDEFGTDEENLEAYLSILGKETPQFCHEVADKVLLVGLGSTAFRTAQYTSHEVSIDKKQLEWFEDIISKHPDSEGWQVFCFSHAPIIGSGLRVLQECHVVNGCCWLNHCSAVDSKRFIEVVRKNACVKAWFSGHFHLSHDYQDSITFPDGNGRGSCVFAQTAVMTARSTRDGRRQSRFLRGNAEGFEICTIDHSKGGKIRLDATITYDECIIDENNIMDGSNSCSTLAYAHQHEDYDHDKWFSAYVPQENDGRYVELPDGTINPGVDFSNPEEVCWWHMKDGAVLGVHNGMIIEYDPSTLAPLGMVVSRDELKGRLVAVIDDDWGGSALLLYRDDSEDVTVVQPNEDGSYWRKVVRNKMHRMQEMRRAAAAKKWMKQQRGEERGRHVKVLSSYGPYTTTAGQVMGLSTRAICPKAKEAA
ncbi:unnamed protein product [Prorocentrum cordatum]|uniref:Calcineurin-like phosphoesterase domain-containing protein n=1 Tax=Prorocentrum cordatum TaxID=2364126 RepID=A0ABN9VPY3_9DINO|nr:unnamed protein product [Polarella glacialis]